MTAPPGWYPNPDGSNSDRHWDGTQWGDIAPRAQSAESSPTKKRRQWPWVFASVFAAGILISATLDNSTPAPRTADTWPTPAQNQPIAEVTDPLTADGTYVVGTEIQPGTYRVQLADDARIGWWTRCAKVDCTRTTNAEGRERSSILGQAAVNSQGYLVIEPTDTAVELYGLVLTPADG